MLLAPQRPSESEGFEEPISLSTWVESPRWAPELTATLEGNCRGSLLNDWAENIRDEWGQSAVELIQRGLEDVGLSLPESPNAKAWYPVGTQLRMMELLLDDIAGKDINALRKFLMKRLFRHRILRFMARRYGLRRILGQADAIHRQCYDQGHASSVVRGMRCQVTLAGGQMVSHPTWQLLQLVGYLTVGNLVGASDVSVSGRYAATQESTFIADIVWGF